MNERTGYCPSCKCYHAFRSFFLILLFTRETHILDPLLSDMKRDSFVSNRIACNCSSDYVARLVWESRGETLPLVEEVKPPAVENTVDLGQTTNTVTSQCPIQWNLFITPKSCKINQMCRGNSNRMPVLNLSTAENTGYYSPVMTLAPWWGNGQLVVEWSVGHSLLVFYHPCFDVGECGRGGVYLVYRAPHL